MNAEAMGRPSLTAGRTQDDLLSRHDRPARRRIAADVQQVLDDYGRHRSCRTETQSGMIVTHGGLEGGYGLYLRDGKPTFVYNFLSIDRPTFTAKEPLPKGKTKLVVDFAYDGGGMGKGGKITMTADGKTIAEGRMERTIPIQFSLGEGLDVGMDIGSPIDFTYDLPFAFTGKIEKIEIKLGPVASATVK